MVLTINQQKSAVHYAVLYLRNEITQIKKDMETETDHTLKKLLKSRLQELEADLKTFETINDQLA